MENNPVQPNKPNLLRRLRDRLEIFIFNLQIKIKWRCTCGSTDEIPWSDKATYCANCGQERM